MKRTDVMTLLRTGPIDVDLLICRPEAGILPDLPAPLQQPVRQIHQVPPVAQQQAQQQQQGRQQQPHSKQAQQQQQQQQKQQQQHNNEAKQPQQQQNKQAQPPSVLSVQHPIENNTHHTTTAPIETPSTRPQSSTSSYSSQSEGEENSVIQSNVALQKAPQNEAGRRLQGNQAEDSTLDKEIQRLNLQEDGKSTIYSESEVDLPSALDQSENEYDRHNIRSHMDDVRSHVDDVRSHVDDVKSHVTGNERADRPVSEARSNTRSDWTGTGTGSFTGSYTTSFYSDEETETTLGPGEFEVTLTKGEKGLGFTVAGGTTSTGFFYVKEILYDPALADGHMQKGDRILRVNGQDMTRLNHQEAIAYLRQTPATVRIRLSRSSVFINPQEGENQAKESTPKTVTTTTTTPTTATTATPAAPATTMKQPSPDAKDAQNKTDAVQRETLGVKGAGDSAETLSRSRHSFGDVASPIPDEGGNEAEKAANQDVDNGSKSRQSQNSEKDVIRIELVKPSSGQLGFSLIQGETGNASALFVRSVTQGGAAAAEGNLRVGDRLLQVNGQSVIGMPHNKAVALIRNVPLVVELAVSRHPSRAGSLSRLSERPSSAHYNTDSDVDSTALDEEENPVLQSARQRQRNHSNNSRNHGDGIGSHGDKTRKHGDAASDSEEYATDDAEVQNITSRAGLTVLQPVRSDDESNYSEGEPNIEFPGEIKEQEKSEPISPRKPLHARIPADVDEEWLETLDLVDIPGNTVNYSGKELKNTIKQLKQEIDNDVPAEEYKNMRHARLTDNSVDARLPENKTKNRYRNVLPYDATRVRLSTGDNDYINASHVRVVVNKQAVRYIACQGPLPQTTGDFWRMIWEQKVEVIAMVTQVVESGKVKCHRYWPESLATPVSVCERFELSLTQVQRLEHFDIHHIKMVDTGSGAVRRILHCNFTSWPDHGTPTTGVPLLQYIRFLRIAQDSSAGPLVVHCSAGIGRTGALITLDAVLTIISKDLKFDIRKLAMDLRRQRQGMIQTKDQYVFCYKAVLEALQLVKS